MTYLGGERPLAQWKFSNFSPLRRLRREEMDPNSPEAWFKSLPMITRSMLVVLFSTTCLVSVGLLDPHVLILDWSLVTRKYVPLIIS